jgi:uncharacterized surface protein with fasciclin (FAS1) repeats
VPRSPLDAAHTCRWAAAVGLVAAGAVACSGTEVPAPPARGATQIVDVFGPRCGELPTDGPGSAQAMATRPVADAVAANPLTAMLGEVIAAADLGPTLDELPAATVYAPSDEALSGYRQRVGEAQWSALLADRARLQELLRHHVSATRATAQQLVAAGASTQLAGGDVQVGGSPLRLTVTGGDGSTARVLCGNIPTANATLFVIDGVRAPAVPGG